MQALVAATDRLASTVAGIAADTIDTGAASNSAASSYEAVEHRACQRISGT